MKLSDLDILAERVHEAAEGSECGWRSASSGDIVWDQYDGLMVFPCYEISEILAHRDKLSGKPTEWVREWANWRAQDQDGQWYEYEHKPSAAFDEWLEDTLSGGRLSTVGKGQVFGDWRDTLEERVWDRTDTETEKEIQGAVMGSEWNGEGLPPVGVECETYCSEDWSKCKVLAYHKSEYNTWAWVLFDGDNEPEGWDCINDDSFRPIKSPREVAIEEIKIILGNYVHAEIPRCAAALYDAGWRKGEASDG